MRQNCGFKAYGFDSLYLNIARESEPGLESIWRAIALLVPLAIVTLCLRGPAALRHAIRFQGSPT